MSDDTGRYGVVRYANHYEVIDKLNRNVTVLAARSRDCAHAECDQLNREHREAQRAKYVRS